MEFQIAPMVDVLLCLLVFFIMTTSASVLRADKNLSLPVAPNSTKKDASRYETLINVRWNPQTKTGEANIESVTTTDLTKIIPLLAPRVKANARYRAVIRADRACPAQYVVKVMNAVAEAGIDDITFSVLNHD